MVVLALLVIMQIFNTSVLDPQESCRFFAWKSGEGLTVAGLFRLTLGALFAYWCIAALERAYAQTFLQLTLLAAFVVAFEGHVAATSNVGTSYGNWLVERTAETDGRGRDHRVLEIAAQNVPAKAHCGPTTPPR